MNYNQVGKCGAYIYVHVHTKHVNTIKYKYTLHCGEVETERKYGQPEYQLGQNTIRYILACTMVSYITDVLIISPAGQHQRQ